MQQAISELIDASLIQDKTVRNTSYYEITDQGKQTLTYFEDQISDGIKKDISEFFKENTVRMREELSAVADYFKSETEGYHVRCQLKREHFTMVDLTIAVPTEDAAAAVCMNWKNKSQDIYENLIDLLL